MFLGFLLSLLLLSFSPFFLCRLFLVVIVISCSLSFSFFYLSFLPHCRFFFFVVVFFFLFTRGSFLVRFSSFIYMLKFFTDFISLLLLLAFLFLFIGDSWYYCHFFFYLLAIPSLIITFFIYLRFLVLLSLLVCGVLQCCYFSFTSYLWCLVLLLFMAFSQWYFLL